MWSQNATSATCLSYKIVQQYCGIEGHSRRTSPVVQPNRSPWPQFTRLTLTFFFSTSYWTKSQQITKSSSGYQQIIVSRIWTHAQLSFFKSSGRWHLKKKSHWSILHQDRQQIKIIWELTRCTQRFDEVRDKRWSKKERSNSSVNSCTTWSLDDRRSKCQWEHNNSSRIRHSGSSCNARRENQSIDDSPLKKIPT